MATDRTFVTSSIMVKSKLPRSSRNSPPASPNTRTRVAWIWKLTPEDVERTEREFAAAEAYEAQWHEEDEKRFHRERLP